MLVGPGEVVWIDVLLPAGDPLWQDDVGRSFSWLGRAWANALAGIGVDAAPHEGPMICTPWCRQVCFAGIGSGELTVGGRKVVGLAQRRTRSGALFHCAALLRWRPEEMARLLDLDEGAAHELADVAVALPVGSAQLEEAFLRQVTALPA